MAKKDCRGMPNTDLSFFLSSVASRRSVLIALHTRHEAEIESAVAKHEWMSRRSLDIASNQTFN